MTSENYHLMNHLIFLVDNLMNKPILYIRMVFKRVGAPVSGCCLS